MPKLWTDTLDEHRRQVRDAIIDATADLVDEHGLLGVNMSQIAERAGIGRKTLYKYYPDVETILAAWHHRQVAGHLHDLQAVRDRATDSTSALRAVLAAHAEMIHQHHGTQPPALDHTGDHVDHAQHELHQFLTSTIDHAAQNGQVRTDIAPGELATYTLHALTAAASLPSKAATTRLVELTINALAPSS